MLLITNSTSILWHIYLTVVVVSNLFKCLLCCLLTVLVCVSPGLCWMYTIVCCHVWSHTMSPTPMLSIYWWIMTTLFKHMSDHNDPVSRQEAWYLSSISAAAVRFTNLVNPVRTRTTPRVQVHFAEGSRTKHLGASSGSESFCRFAPAPNLWTSGGLEIYFSCFL